MRDVRTSEHDRYGGWRCLQMGASGYFRLESFAGRCWFVTPEGHPFISIGLNHISSFSLRRPGKLDDFLARYRGEEGWIREAVVPDLKDWGFNTIGWTQEIALRYPPQDPFKRLDPPDARRGWGGRFALLHDRPWEQERYSWAGMPYCHVLNIVAQAYYYDGSVSGLGEGPHYPDVFSPWFEDHCDQIARSYAATMRDDPNLVGYFLADVPDWSGEVHGRHWTRQPDGTPHPDAQERLAAIAERYFSVACGAIRRYDPNHLILGDRLLGGRDLPHCVLHAMRPHVDVLSVQFGGDFAAEEPQLAEWQAVCGKPILLCDAVMPPQYYDPPRQKHRGEAYKRYLSAALANDSIIGVHFCGAYLEAEPRGWGVRDADGVADPDLVDAFREAHTAVWDIVGKKLKALQQTAPPYA